MQLQVLELLPQAAPTLQHSQRRTRRTQAVPSTSGSAVLAVLDRISESEPGLAHRAVTMAGTMATGLDRSVSRGKRAHVRSKASTADGSQQRIGMSRASVAVAAAPATAGGAGGPGGRPVRVRQAPSDLEAYEHRAGVVPIDSSEAVLRQPRAARSSKFGRFGAL